MATTEKYKLPLISGNMTADVVRDMNALATKTDEVIATLASASANKGKFDALAAEFAAHKIGIESEEGVHNLRYFNDKFEIKVGDEWRTASDLAKPKDAQPPSPITNFKAAPEDKSITLTWANPNDDDFEKVIIRYQTGSYPTSETDGQSAYDGKALTTTVSGLQNNTEYFFRAFTVDTSGNVNKTTVGMQLKATPISKVLYGVEIDYVNALDPDNGLTYTQNSAQFTNANNNRGGGPLTWGSWQDKFPFNQIKPCLLKGGQVTYLNPTDFTKLLTGGGPADITSGDAGDVMIEIPKVYWYMADVGGKLTIQISNSKINENFKCYAHTRGNVEKDKLYIGAYLGHEAGGKLRSLSGKATASKTLSQMRALAKANGQGYELMNFFQYSLMQILYTLLFKGLDSQRSFGHSREGAGVPTGTTGGTEQKGMLAASPDALSKMKFLGIEDFLGNGGTQIDGAILDADGTLLLATENFNDSGSGYPIQVPGFNVTGNSAYDGRFGLVSKVSGTTEGCFVMTESLATSNGYYSDWVNLNSGQIPRNDSIHVETDNTNLDFNGMYNLSFDLPTSEPCQARLVYL